MAVFVDTDAWFAASVPSDPDHAAAAAFLWNNQERLVTTDLILAELLTLFRIRGQLKRAELWIGQVRRNECELIRCTDTDLEGATEIFFQFSDKQWSFTDCVSRVVMDRLGIQIAFAFDEHFRQFGTVTVVP